MSINPLAPIAGSFAIHAVGRLAQPIVAGASFLQTLVTNEVHAEKGGDTPIAQSGPTRLVYDMSAEPALGLATPAVPPDNGAGIDRDVLHRLGRFRSLLDQRLSSLGLNAVAPLRLRTDKFGELDSIDVHPQAREIEQVMASDRALQDALRDVIVLLQELHSRRQGHPSAASSNDPSFPGTGPWADLSGSYSTVELEFDGPNVRVTVAD